MKSNSLFAMLVGAAVMLAVPAVAAAESAADFYRGQTLTVIVPYGVGGHFDSWARLVGAAMKTRLGLKSVQVVNRPGGGGLIGSNQIYDAAPDGLTIGDTNAPGDYFAQILKVPGVKFRMQRFDWIGRPDDDPAAIAAHPGSAIKSFADLLDRPADKPVTVLASGKGSNEYNAAYITLKAFQVPFRMVAAFKGAHSVIAGFVASEGDLMPMAASHMVELGDKVHVVLMVTTRPYAKLRGVPTVVEAARKQGLSAETTTTLAQLASVMSLGHAFVAPPGVPRDRLRLLRRTFKEIFSDPAFIRKVRAGGLYAGYRSGAEVRRMVHQSLAHEADFKRLLSKP